MKKLFDKLTNKLNVQEGFLKSVSILVGGTAAAQFVNIAALPIITRLYSPAEFSIFSVYVSILSILTVASCLRFEIAIPIPNKDEDALILLILALISNLLISAVVSLIILFFSTDLLSLINQKALAPFVWLIPVGIFCSGLYNSLQFWNTRKKQFPVIAKTRMIQSIGGMSTQIGLGYLHFGIVGLIIGQIVNYSAGSIRLFLNVLNEFRNIKNKVTINKICSNFKKYDNFPKYSSLDALANTAGIQLPIIIIASLALGAEAGYLMLAMQVLGIPMKFIGGAVSQVYLAHAPEAYEKGDIRVYTIDILKNLYKFSFSILIFIGIVSPLVVEYIFGTEWKSVGLIISWMIPWFVFQLISSPVSMIMHIANKQKTMLFLTLFGLFLKIGVIYGQYYINSKYMLQAYAISSAFFYIVCCIVFSKTAMLKLTDHFFLIRKSIFSSLIMILIGIIIVFVFRGIGL